MTDSTDNKDFNYIPPNVTIYLTDNNTSYLTKLVGSPFYEECKQYKLWNPFIQDFIWRVI